MTQANPTWHFHWNCFVLHVSQWFRNGNKKCSATDWETKNANYNLLTLCK